MIKVNAYAAQEAGADAVTLSPLAGQDIAAPFLLYPEKAVVVTCHSSNPAAKVGPNGIRIDDGLPSAALQRIA